MNVTMIKPSLCINCVLANCLYSCDCPCHSQIIMAKMSIDDGKFFVATNVLFWKKYRLKKMQSFRGGDGVN